MHDLVSHVRTFLTGIQVVCYRLNRVVGVLNRNRCRREELNVLAHEPFVAGNAGVGGRRTAEDLKTTRPLSWTAGCSARWAPSRHTRRRCRCKEIDDERLSCEHFDEPHCGCTSIINGTVTQGDSEP